MMSCYSIGQPCDLLQIMQRTGSQRRAVVLESVLATILSFAILSTYAHLSIFTDEVDNLIGARFISEGKNLYLNYYSQHPPFMYYFATIPLKIGLTNLFEIRLYLYLFSSICLGIFVVAYSKFFPSRTIFLFSIMYATLFASPLDVSYSFLSEQIVALIFVALALEFIRICRTNHQLSTLRLLYLAALATCSVATAFISIYFVFFIVISIYVINLRRFKIQLISLKSLKDLAICIVPTFFLLIIAIKLRILKPMIEQAYFLNVITYTKYLDGLDSGLFSPIVNAFNSQTEYIQVFNSQISLEQKIWYVSFSLSMMIALVYLCRVNFAIGVAALLLTILAAPRGIAGFHAFPYYSVLAIFASTGIALLFNFESKQSAFKSPTKFLILALLIFGLSTPYIKYFESQESFGYGKFLKLNSEGKGLTKSEVLNALTKPDETFFQTSANVEIYTHTSRTFATKASAIVPWFAEVYGDEILSDLEKQKPALIFHNDKNSVWGYSISDYAPAICAYIELNYSKLALKLSQGKWIDYVYLRKDLVFERMDKIQQITN